MFLKWLFITYFYVSTIKCEEKLDILIKTRSSFLEKYTQYVDVVIMHFVIPEDISFVSFKFIADETDMSIFGCDSRNVSLFMKHGAPPVINPDGAKFPHFFVNITRETLYHFDFKSDKVERYINITSPLPGSYYVVTFLAYSDPRNNAIKQQGLSRECFASVDCTVHVKRADSTNLAVEDKNFSLSAEGNKSTYYKFHVPEAIDYIIITVDNVIFSNSASKLIIRAQNHQIPSNETYDVNQTISQGDKQPVHIKLWTEEDSWSYIEFYFELSEDVDKKTESSQLDFKIHFFSDEIFANNSSKSDNTSSKYHNAISKLYRTPYITRIMPYHQYNLLREASTESLLFSYVLEDEIENITPVPINLTSSEFITFRFPIMDLSDIGGTLQYILAFKPRIKRTGLRRSLEPEPENHVVVACISKGSKSIPMWPNKCSYNGTKTKAPLILNKDEKNSTILIPYPESGIWYATFKLFCGTCERCNCSKLCQYDFETCVTNCEDTCNSKMSCNSCVDKCKNQVVSKESCEGCDCDGKCRRTTTTCNTSLIFDISSSSCIQGECGKNGKCALMVSDGVVYSSCMCLNRYRGWGCNDDSLANPYWMVVLELLLLVLSNLMFLPAVYVAFKRKYYIESICYFAICFFSTFYHACDAGEHLINFCLTRLSSLQFADFFCALLAIWVTLIAIADLPYFIPSICHILGAIILAFCTTINKTALWIFAMPAASGVLIICISWYLKYRKVKQMFIRKRYIYINLPIGVLLVTVGLIIYTALQTENNYKYLHSMWHVLMAVAVWILLPQKDTFHPEPTL